MTPERPRFEVADVVRAHEDEYRRAYRLSAAQAKVLRHIATCRTAVLGGHVDKCDRCGQKRISYNSCRDRHCPKCQGPQRAQWLARRLEHLLAVPYFHVVFTIPDDDLNPLTLRNKRLIYQLIFAAASEALLELARDRKHLGAQIGFTAVLHTWGQNLSFHPHLHCVVTGGGLSEDRSRWVAGRDPRYLVPVKALGALFRGKFLHALQDAYEQGQLELGGSIAELADPVLWAAFRDRLYNKNWVVHAKPPFGGPEQVFRYLGRYTHRVAISNRRINNLADGQVTFSYKDYANGGARRLMTLEAVEFLRRFLLHVLPRGFVRIRHYGLCAAANIHTKLATARRLLEPDPAPATPHEPESDPNSAPGPAPEPRPWWELLLEQTGFDVLACPSCGLGRMHRHAQVVVRRPRTLYRRPSPRPEDTS